jgi:hypothetical protein
MQILQIYFQTIYFIHFYERYMYLKFYNFPVSGKKNKQTS